MSKKLTACLFEEDVRERLKVDDNECVKHVSSLVLNRDTSKMSSAKRLKRSTFGIEGTWFSRYPR
jgi:hypothetical protein